MADKAQDNGFSRLDMFIKIPLSFVVMIKGILFRYGVVIVNQIIFFQLKAADR